MPIPASYGSASSAGLPVDETSYLSAVTADCVEDLNTRLQEIARLQPPGPMHLQLDASTAQPPAASSPPVAPASQQQVLQPVVMLIPVYPLHLGNVTPTMPTSSASPPVASPQKSAHSQNSKKRRSVASENWRQAREEPLEKRQQTEKENHTLKSLPEASEEKWQKRIGKRQEAITNMKSLPMYYEHHQNIARERRPKSPNVFNRDFSKRDWEGVVAQWRSSWREIAGQSDLEAMGYSRKDSLDAWRKVEMRCKKAEEHEKLSPEQRQLEHKKQALSILLGEFA